MANDGMEVADVAATEKKRQEKTKRVFVNAAGEKTPRAKLDSVGVEITFVRTGEVLKFNFDDFTPEVQRAGALWGIMTAVTNTVGKAGLSDAEISEAANDRLATLLDGQWTAEAQSGPRDSDILLAAERFQRERNLEWNDTVRDTMRAKLADEATGGDYRKRLLSVPAFKAHFEAVKAERAQERAKKAAADATGSPTSDILDL